MAGTVRSSVSVCPPGPPSGFAAALGPRPEALGPASFVGLEHEYTLTSGGERLDFRRMIRGLDLPGRCLDPGDANAYRCRSGLVVTCDDEEAEVVSPPVPVRPGFTVGVSDWAARAVDELRRLLPDAVAMHGFSTHLSASMPPWLAGPVCDLFAETFGPALMLVLDRPDSHGLFLRARPGRVELCGEFATGPRLGAAAALVAGGTMACAAALAGPAGLGPVTLPGGPRPVTSPPLLAVDVRPATGRPGLFVGRRLGFGFDLYAAGRRARLPLAGGGVITAQAHLERAWEAARAGLGAAAGPEDLDAGDRMVAGSSPLGVEMVGDDERHQVRPPTVRSPFGEILGHRRRPAFDVAAVAATWDFTVFRFGHARRIAYACVPTPWLERFLDRLDRGLLDGVLADFLDRGPAGRVLRANNQTREPDLWDDAVIGPDLLPSERLADKGDLRSPTPSAARFGKGTLLRRPLALPADRPIPPPASSDPTAAEPGSAPTEPTAAPTAAEPGSVRTEPTTVPTPTEPTAAPTEPTTVPTAGEPGAVPTEPTAVPNAGEPVGSVPTQPTAVPAARVPAARVPTTVPTARVPAGVTIAVEPGAGDPVAGEPGVSPRVRGAVPIGRPTLAPADERPPQIDRPGPRRWVRVLVALVGLLLVGAVTVLVGGGDTEVMVRTSPSDSPPPTVIRQPPTSVPDTTVVRADPTSTDAPAAPATPIATVAPTVAPRSTSGATTTPATDPVATVPPETTVPPTSEPPTTVTTVVVDPPTDVVVAVVTAGRGCAFQPASITVAVGSTVAFRNDTDLDVTIIIAGTTIALDSGGSSGPTPLSTAGRYAVTCTLGGGGVPGGMTVTVTGG